MLADVGMEAALIESSVLSVIIMALWQRARNATLAAMRERNASIVAKEAEETRIAALAERARIARDMHDVVAHTLSTIIVQSDGGRYAGAHDLAIAKHTMGTIRHEADARSMICSVCSMCSVRVAVPDMPTSIRCLMVIWWCPGI